ncbi:MAG TPA: S8 family serine peptidase [Hyphomicrobiaceae bacterium]
MANRAQPFNASALQQMGVPPLDSGIDGRGIVIGVIDYGFDILHPCFRYTATGQTRFRYLWDQNTGREFDARDVDRLIAASDRTGSRDAADAEYDPHANYFGRYGVQSGAHGTVMAAIAAASPVAGFRGVAPAADLIAVQLGLLDHHWREEDENGLPTWRHWRPEMEPVWNGWRSYDEAAQIVSALEYIYARAVHLNARGLVVNLSIGAYAGAHDGRSRVEQAISDLTGRCLQSDLPCAVVVGAGNAGLEEGHFGGKAEPGRPLSFAWRMHRDDPTQNKLEIWYRSETPLEISVSPHPGHPGWSISPGRTHTIELCGTRIGIADHVPFARSPRSRIRIAVHPPYVPDHFWHEYSGELSLEINCSATGSCPADIHAWVERDDGLANRSTLYPAYAESTLASLAAAEGAIIAAGYDHHRTAANPDPFPASSLGPLPWAVTKDAANLICAPAHRIWGARSKTAGFVETSGTSAAAALTSGAMALLMQCLASRRGLEPQRWTDLLVPRRDTWSPRFGFGPVNIADTLKEVRG